VNGGPTEFDRVRSLRDVLTATGAGIYLNTHLAGPVPAETMAAVHESDEMELRVGRAGPDREDDLEQREKEARAVAAAAVKASPDRVVLTHGAPQAVGTIVAALLAVTPRSEADGTRVIIVDGMAAPVVASVEAVAAAAGLGVDLLEATPQIISADVALIVMAHVDADGAVADVARTRTAARNAGAKLIVDASFSVGAIPVEVADLDADVVVADTQRWLLGPESVALVWLSPELGEELPDRLRASVGAFGRGTLLALARSVGWLLMYAELPWVLGRTSELAERLYRDLRSIDGIEVLVDGPQHGALVSFRIQDWDAEQAAEELGRSVFAILEADAEHDVLRASVGAWNRDDELDRFMERVAELAEHTPETLPRKPSLTVISGPTLLPDIELEDR
jgi:selenocysteine lyase/cysteine desulfurase